MCIDLSKEIPIKRLFSKTHRRGQFNLFFFKHDVIFVKTLGESRGKFIVEARYLHSHSKYFSHSVLLVFGLVEQKIRLAWLSLAINDNKTSIKQV